MLRLRLQNMTHEVNHAGYDVYIFANGHVVFAQPVSGNFVTRITLDGHNVRIQRFIPTFWTNEGDDKAYLSPKHLRLVLLAVSKKDSALGKSVWLGRTPPRPTFVSAN